MENIYFLILAQLNLLIPEITFIHRYNSQFDDLEDGEIYSFPMPCVFVEFDESSPIKQLGNGCQIYDPLIINIHIGHNLENNPGFQEQNDDVFILKQKVFKALNLFQPQGCGPFVRSGEIRDPHHTNVYHYIQSYTTTFIDTGMNQPVNGQTIAGPIELDTTIIIED